MVISSLDAALETPYIVMFHHTPNEFDIICGSSSKTKSSSGMRTTHSPATQSRRRSSNTSRNRTTTISATTSSPGDQRLHNAVVKFFDDYATATNRTEQMRATRNVLEDVLSVSSSSKIKTRFLTEGPMSGGGGKFCTASIRAIRDKIWYCLSTMKARKMRRDDGSRRGRRHQHSTGGKTGRKKSFVLVKETPAVSSIIDDADRDYRQSAVILPQHIVPTITVLEILPSWWWMPPLVCAKDNETLVLQQGKDVVSSAADVDFVPSSCSSGITSTTTTYGTKTMKAPTLNLNELHHHADEAFSDDTSKGLYKALSRGTIIGYSQQPVYIKRRPAVKSSPFLTIVKRSFTGSSCPNPTAAALRAQRNRRVVSTSLTATNNKMQPTTRANNSTQQQDTFWPTRVVSGIATKPLL